MSILLMNGKKKFINSAFEAFMSVVKLHLYLSYDILFDVLKHLQLRHLLKTMKNASLHSVLLSMMSQGLRWAEHVVNSD